MSDYKVFLSAIFESNGYPKTGFNDALNSFIQNNSEYMPYGSPQLYQVPGASNKAAFYIQAFVKYNTQLSDKFLETLITELQHIPEFGSAYKQAEENFKQNIQNQNPVNNGGKKNKTFKKKYIKK